MTRIIGGSLRGQRLSVPARVTRPTSDRIREALFSSLESWLITQGLTWGEIDVVDLFAGSGAVGLEAASRGARSVALIDSDRGAVSVITENNHRLGSHCEIMSMDATRWKPRKPCGVVFMDPPYSMSDSDVSAMVLRLVHNSVMDGCLIVVERAVSSSDPFAQLDESSIEKKWERRYGDSRLWYGHLVGESP
ncbi:MAG: RsmD family RNA methyltransferase [Candidatus Nanopelagicales bacterium]|nr:RsmD family RNA methyltransferase [Candidatus Nanopelagicales bacterium]